MKETMTGIHAQFTSPELTRWEYEHARQKTEYAAKKEEERLNAYGAFDLIWDAATRIKHACKNFLNTRSH